MALLETIDLCQRFDNHDILKNINLKVEKGEVFALIGPTGAGKTTFLRLLNLLDLPASGIIYFDGIDTAGSAGLRTELRRRMGFVFQKPVVFNMSVYDNIACGLKWRKERKSEIRQKVNSMLELVSLSDYKDRNARTLSGGEVQMVAIARAMVSEPEVLLLDEPTANLDPVSASRIESLIADIAHRHNTTIIMATHDMSQGQRLADRVGVLLNGEIQQSGNWQEVFNSPRNKDVAYFVSAENIIDGVVASNQDEIAAINVGDNTIEVVSDYPAGEEVCVCLRPEDITIAKSQISSSARNSFAGKITRMVALITRRSAEELDLNKGTEVYVSFKATAAHVIKR
jgi:tungstate transport system ATP-binding protein